MHLGRLFSIPVRLNLFSLPMMAVAFWVGEGERLAVMAGSILIHEMMHVAAARILHVRVYELELTPAGGAARMENLWRLRPGQMAAVALAGPAANLLIIIMAAALCWWDAVDARMGAMVIEQNLIILLFNMLPALPMDGGRILCGILSRRMSAAGAARTGMKISIILAAILAALSVYGLANGRLNITLPMAAVFLATSAGRERRQAEFAMIESLTSRRAELEAEGVLPMRWLAVHQDLPVREAAVRMKPRYMHLIAVCDDSLRVMKVIGEAELTEALLAEDGIKIGQINCIVKKKVF